MFEDHIVVDIESEFLFKEIKAERDNALAKLGTGCAVVYSYANDDYEVYGKGSVQYLKERLLEADKITGFNTWNFDYPVIWGMTKAEWAKSADAQKILPKTNDLLRRVWISAGLNPNEYGSGHRGYSLKNITNCTLGITKEGDGQEAPMLLREGHWDLVLTYCLRDVKLTRDLDQFIDKYSYVITNKNQILKIWAKPDEVV